jgi:hypothetical protein
MPPVHAEEPAFEEGIKQASEVAEYAVEEVTHAQE